MTDLYIRLCVMGRLQLWPRALFQTVYMTTAPFDYTSCPLPVTSNVLHEGITYLEYIVNWDILDI